MARVQDTWRLHRLKADFLDESYGGATHPATLESVHWAPCRAVFVYLVPLTVGGTRVAYSAADTFSITGIKLVDNDVDDAVDATDDAVRTATLTGCTYYTEIRIPLGGALRWGVELTTMDTPATATQVQIRFREDTEDTD